MSEKTITREEFMVAVIAMREVYCGKGGLDTKPELYAQAAAEAFGIMVEPEPVVPGASGGEWIPCCGHDSEKGIYYIFAKNDRIAVVYNVVDRTLMAGAKALVEKVVAMFIANNPSVKMEWSDESKMVIEHLRSLSVDVSEFER